MSSPEKPTALAVGQVTKNADLTTRLTDLRQMLARTRCLTFEEMDALLAIETGVKEQQAELERLQRLADDHDQERNNYVGVRGALEYQENQPSLSVMKVLGLLIAWRGAAELRNTLKARGKTDLAVTSLVNELELRVTELKSDDLRALAAAPQPQPVPPEREAQTRALFLLAGFTIEKIEQIENQYWPKHPNYDSVRRKEPWWRVKTPQGEMVIGRRKRVYSLSWEAIGGVEAEQLTQDDVTKYDHVIHAWTLPKALEYLSSLRAQLSAVREEAVD